MNDIYYFYSNATLASMARSQRLTATGERTEQIQEAPLTQRIFGFTRASMSQNSTHGISGNLSESLGAASTSSLPSGSQSVKSKTCRALLLNSERTRTDEPVSIHVLLSCMSGTIWPQPDKGVGIVAFFAIFPLFLQSRLKGFCTLDSPI